ncbi:MAG: EutN/CcmL family microcompartment protein [Myxococcales bacterium]|nr:EutN/CcmL family microcompartment protein [Myxococcales bacterium]
MVIGKVVGTVVASQKEAELVGLKFLAVQPLDLATGEVKDGGVIAVDAVGAGVGEIVLYASGSSARQTTVTQNRPVDATIMAIVDTFEVGGEVRYRK